MEIYFFAVVSVVLSLAISISPMSVQAADHIPTGSQLIDTGILSNLPDIYSVYQAEAAQRGGWALIKDNSQASGGMVVSHIGGPDTDIGSVGFDVYAPENGIYGAIVAFLNDGAKDFYIQANDSPATRINPSQVSNPTYDQDGQRYVELPLKRGSNKVVVYSLIENAISLDYLVVFAPQEDFTGGISYKEAFLSGSAQIRKCAGSQDGNIITDIGPNGSAMFTYDAMSTGYYNMTIWYSSAEYRALEINVNNVLEKRIFCPITAELYNVDTISTRIYLRRGKNNILFKNALSAAPDIEKIQLSRTNNMPVNISPPPKAENFSSGDTRIEYNMSKGTYNAYFQGVLRASNIEGVVKLTTGNNTSLKSSDYTSRYIEEIALEDGYGKGTKYSVISTATGLATMVQSFYVYENLPYVLTQVALRHDGSIKTNFMSPISAASADCVNIGAKSDARFLFVPFDNDSWVRYGGQSLGGSHTSYWATAIYDNASRNSLVIGSVDHDTWKTGVTVHADKSTGAINFLGAVSGIWSSKYTYDHLPHGAIDGLEVVSPKFFIGYFPDWRDGMEEYSDANTKNIAPLNWDGPTPFGYNSWYAQADKLNLEESKVASNFIKELEDFKDDDVQYICLDSFWDNMNEDQLREFVETCKSNGQKAGIYWAHYVAWGLFMMNSTTQEDSTRTYRDAVVTDNNGHIAAISKLESNNTPVKSLPLDPTSDIVKKRVENHMKKFTSLGFEYLKIDFLNYSAIEGNFADPNVKTGMQAYNMALKEFTKYVDTDKFFLSYSIAPLFPYQYGHARRISCDVGSGISEAEYMLNSLTYGWWANNSVYRFTDPDHISLSSSSAARARYSAAVIAGTVMLLSDVYTGSTGNTIKNRTISNTSNQAINDIARLNRAFKPIDGNTGDSAAEAFMLKLDERTTYLAVFNYSSSILGSKRITVNLDRLGLSGDKNYKFTELWSNTVTNDIRGTGNWQTPTMSRSTANIYKIEEQ